MDLEDHKVMDLYSKQLRLAVGYHKFVKCSLIKKVGNESDVIFKHRQIINSVCFAENGRFLLTAGVNKIVRRFDLDMYFCSS